jgi:hypothetical protein
MTKKSLGATQQSSAKIDRAVQLAAFELMCRGRPLKPPPCNFDSRRVTAAELALRADKKAGIW